MNMKNKITDASIKRLFTMFGDDYDKFVGPLPVIKQWIINEQLRGGFHNNLADLVARIRDTHPHLVFQIAYNLSYELKDAEDKLKVIKRSFEIINEL